MTSRRADFYLFDGSTMINLSNDLQIGGATGFASINDSGHVAFMWGASGVPGNRLFFYDGTETIDLMPTLGLPGGISIHALSLNNRDQLAFATESSSGERVLWFFDLRAGFLKQVDSDIGPPPTVQINESGNIAYIKNQNIMLAVASSVLEVAIEIRPKSDANNINPTSNQNINVAILSVNDFDATTVDPDTVLFGNTVRRHRRSRLAREMSI